MLRTHEPPKVTRLLKVDHAYEELKRLIITMQLAPGAHIDERELMERFGIGRTPLREAVLRLVHERLVVHTPRRGAWVSPLSITDLHQMMEARLIVDSITARLAAERVIESDIHKLREIVEAGQKAVEEKNSEVVVELDFELHRYIAECSGNVYWASFSEQIHSSMLRYWHLSARNDETLPTWGSNHIELVRAIASGDPYLAEKQAERHALGLQKLLRDLVV